MFQLGFTGYTTLLFALYGIVRHWSKARFWMLVAVLYVAVEHAIGAPAGQAAGLGVVQVQALLWTYDPSGQAYTLYTRWGQAILLSAYDVRRDSAEALRLTLYWQALREMDVSYEVSVYLVDQSTGAIVRRCTKGASMPRRDKEL